jgi:UDP-2-acetamido-3-amino-2,3-dideoxy-glucuronate N-acetyltransferase
MYPQVKMVEDVKPVLEDPDIRGVVIASSAVSHYALVRQMLMADKDVLVEKPMTLDVADAYELVRKRPTGLCYGSEVYLKVPRGGSRWRCQSREDGGDI